MPFLAQIGSLVGIVVTPPITAMIGYKRTVLFMLIISAGLVCMPFFSKTPQMLSAAFALQGIPWGVFQVVSPAYASEVASLQLRPILTTWNNLCWVLGQLLAAGICKGFETRSDQWGYRVPFAFEWAFTAVLIIAIMFAPESPYWYLQKEKTAEAKTAIRKIVRKGAEEATEAKYALMQHTLCQEKQNETENASGLQAWADIFKGTDRRRTEITATTWIIQALCGSALIGWTPTLLQRGGLSNEDSYSFNLAVMAAGALGTIASWWLMMHVGRQKIYFWGLAAMAAVLLVFGFSSFVSGGIGGWVAGGIMMLFTVLYDLTVGPICYSLVAEIPAVRRRAATMSAARGAYLIANFFNFFVVPKMTTETADGGWGWGVKSGFLYAAMCGLGATYGFFRIPSTAGISAREMDILFRNKVSARKFSPEEANALDQNATGFRSMGSNSSVDKPKVVEKPWEK